MREEVATLIARALYDRTDDSELPRCPLVGDLAADFLPTRTTSLQANVRALLPGPPWMSLRQFPTSCLPVLPRLPL